MAKTKTCYWRHKTYYLDDDFDHWKTECGGTIQFIEGNISDNKYIYCPYCGRKIKHLKEW